jgi:hypothetical protein
MQEVIDAKVRAAFGRRDVTGATAYGGGEAQRASQAMGAAAYTTGNQVGFKSEEAHTGAHEAAHVVQQGKKVFRFDAPQAAEATIEEMVDKIAHSTRAPHQGRVVVMSPPTANTEQSLRASQAVVNGLANLEQAQRPK